MRKSWVAAARAEIRDRCGTTGMTIAWLPIVLAFIGCGSRGAVDLLGTPSGGGGASLTDSGSREEDSAVPMDAMLAPDGSIAMDVSSADVRPSWTALVPRRTARPSRRESTPRPTGRPRTRRSMRGRATVVGSAARNASIP